MSTPRTLIKAALRKIGIVTDDASIEQDAFADMKRMLEVWSTKRILVPASTEDNFALVAGTSAYTMGTAGTASTVRAKKILSAFVRDSSDYDHPVEIITEKQYNDIPSKSTRGRPYLLFYDPKYAVGVINLYYTPNAAETMYIESLQLLQTIDLVTTTITLPGDYEEAVIYNLAIRLAPEHEIPIPIEVAALAGSSYDNIVILNASSQVEPVRLDPGIASAGRAYNVNADM